MTPEEGRQILDNAARSLLNISGEEFVDRWFKGEYDIDDPALHSALVDLEMLLPFAGKHSA